ncbi:MAG: 2-C-methyl-D-erythritol 4-phosphate cytidylyltransferase [Chlamydiota bacterium]
MNNVSVIILGGGIGSRMAAPIPKQFMKLHGKPLILHSLEVFLSLGVGEIIVVCAEEYRFIFSSYNVKFASPGHRRQDSVYNGLKEANPTSEVICIHDAARPFITTTMVQNVLSAVNEYGAATVGMPVAFTVKQADENGFVSSTLDRSHIWEIQTPQALRQDLLRKGFEYANHHHLTVTDDVSLAELLGEQVKLIEGSRKNIKITTPEDLSVAQQIAGES